MARAGIPVCKAAEEVSISYFMGLKLCRSAKVRLTRGRRKGSRYPVIDPIRKAAALAMIASGEKLRDAAAAVNVSHESVRQWALQEDVPLPRARKKRAPGAPWASKSKSSKKMISKPEAPKAPPPDPGRITIRGVTLARFA